MDGFTCIVHLQKIIQVPDKISIKVPKLALPKCLYVNHIQLLLCFSVSRIVSSIECYISPSFQRYSSAVVLTPKPNTYFADL
jgi:hypothetical protein